MLYVIRCKERVIVNKLYHKSEEVWLIELISLTIRSNLKNLLSLVIDCINTLIILLSSTVYELLWDNTKSFSHFLFEHEDEATGKN